MILVPTYSACAIRDGSAYIDRKFHTGICEYVDGLGHEVTVLAPVLSPSERLMDGVEQTRLRLHPNQARAIMIVVDARRLSLAVCVGGGVLHGKENERNVPCCRQQNISQTPTRGAPA